MLRLLASSLAAAVLLVGCAVTKDDLDAMAEVRSREAVAPVYEKVLRSARSCYEDKGGFMVTGDWLPATGRGTVSAYYHSDYGRVVWLHIDIKPVPDGSLVTLRQKQGALTSKLVHIDAAREWLAENTTACPF